MVRWDRRVLTTIFCAGMSACGTCIIANLMIAVLPTTISDRGWKEIAATEPIPEQQVPYPGEKKAMSTLTSEHPVHAWAIQPGRTAILALRVDRGPVWFSRFAINHDGQITLCQEPNCGEEPAKFSPARPVADQTSS